MDTVTINMEFPRDVLIAAAIVEANASTDIKKHLALHMFKERILSFGKAAEGNVNIISDKILSK